LAAADPNGITNIKLLPMADTGRVNSAPNCFASALPKGKDTEFGKQLLLANAQTERAAGQVV
jgi:hypothetical protein